MAPHPEIALGEKGLRSERKRDGDERERQRRWGTCRIEPHDAGGGERQFEHIPDELSCRERHHTQAMDGMAAIGHVRCRPAVDVAIVEVWKLPEKRYPQSGFELSPEPLQVCQDRELE